MHLWPLLCTRSSSLFAAINGSSSNVNGFEDSNTSYKITTVFSPLIMAMVFLVRFLPPRIPIEEKDLRETIEILI